MLELEKENIFLENEKKIKMQELENKSKLEMLDKQIELEKAEVIKKSPENKHKIKVPNYRHLKRENMTWMHIYIILKDFPKLWDGHRRNGQ